MRFRLYVDGLPMGDFTIISIAYELRDKALALGYQSYVTQVSH